MKVVSYAELGVRALIELITNLKQIYMSALSEKFMDQFTAMSKQQVMKVIGEVEESDNEVMVRAMVMDWVTDSGKMIQIQIIATNHESEQLTPFDVEVTKFQSVGEFMASKEA